MRVQTTAVRLLAALVVVLLGAGAAFGAAKGKPKGKAKGKDKGATTATAATAAAAAPAAAAVPGAKTAKDWYEEGAKHHKLGEFAEAVKAYKEAYRLAPHSAHLYNLALVNADAGDYKESVRYFRLYLGEEPSSPLRAEIDKRIGELETKDAARDATSKRALPSEGPGPAGVTGSLTVPADSASSVAVSPPPAPVKRGGSTGVVLGVAIGGGALLVGGAVVAAILLTTKTASERYIEDFPGSIVDLGAN